MEDMREFPSTFHKHYLDDPAFDFAVDDSEGGNWGPVFAHIVLIVIAALGWYYRPLVKQLAGPKPQIIESYGIQWRIGAGIKINEQAHTVECQK